MAWFFFSDEEGIVNFLMNPSTNEYKELPDSPFFLFPPCSLFRIVQNKFLPIKFIYYPSFVRSNLNFFLRNTSSSCADKHNTRTVYSGLAIVNLVHDSLTPYSTIIQTSIRSLANQISKQRQPSRTTMSSPLNSLSLYKAGNCISPKTSFAKSNATTNLETSKPSVLLQHSQWRRSLKRRHGVCFNERLHWLCWRRIDGLDISKFVVAFDLANEVFGEMQLPALYNDNEFKGDDMVVLEGCLCLLIWLASERIDVWMMVEYGVRESWTRFTIANPEYTVRVLCLSAQDELVLRRKKLRFDLTRRVVDEFDGEKLVLYNPKEGTRRDIAVSGIPTNYIVGANYMENLVSPNNEERIRRQGEA